MVRLWPCRLELCRTPGTPVFSRETRIRRSADVLAL